ncbi:hypothetical protein D3C71_2092250 [compost metagenome]
MSRGRGVAVIGLRRGMRIRLRVCASSRGLSRPRRIVRECGYRDDRKHKQSTNRKFQ